MLKWRHLLLFQCEAEHKARRNEEKMDIESDRNIYRPVHQNQGKFSKKRRQAPLSILNPPRVPCECLQNFTQFYINIRKLQIARNRANWASEIVMELVQQLHPFHSLPWRGQVSELCIEDKFYGSLISNSEQGQHARQALGWTRWVPRSAARNWAKLRDLVWWLGVNVKRPPCLLATLWGIKIKTFSPFGFFLVP